MLEGHGTQGYIVSRLSVVQAHAFHAGEYKCSPLTDKTHSVYVIGGKMMRGYSRLLQLHKFGFGIVFIECSVTLDLQVMGWMGPSCFETLM